ncbi:alpha/beta fold hydrolase [Clostridium sp. HV4-5-A1G]|nr:alpha/beta fold hydrolase [Clostridium sp. HV4-5-A1G]KAA8668361.1 alpha/beta fold hydrolase [Clostridium sp. HV4-5-A1G]
MVENFEVKNKAGKVLRGIINRPEIEYKMPCIIFCHGFMGNKLGHDFMFVKIARILESMGVVSVRFDFAGSGESDGDFLDLTISGEIEDCSSVIDYVNSVYYVDKNKINILGFSMGGAVAAVIACNYSNLIKNTVLISPAFNMYDVFINEVRGSKLEKFLHTGYIEFENNRLYKSAVEDAFNYNFFDYLKGIMGKVLIVQGTEDQSVPPLYSKRIKEMLEDKAFLKFVSGADHCYSSVAYFKQLADNIVDFTKKYII